MSPLVYPKIRHVRTENPPEYTSYKTYKPFLRREFSGLCVYCRHLDTWFPDGSSFGVDHYRPKDRFRGLTNTYSNLFYCCNRCNSFKGAYWPPSVELEGVDFIPNPCDHEMFSHMRYVDGVVEPKSKAGERAVKILDLNDDRAVSFRKAKMIAVAGILAARDECLRVASILRQRLQGAAPQEKAAIEADLSILGEEVQQQDRALELYGTTTMRAAR